MRAVVAQDNKLSVQDVETPTPGDGQVLVKTLSCGICGSDLHALKHGDELVDVARRAGSELLYDAKKPVVFGHEFAAEVLDNGPNTMGTFKPGTRIVSMPVVLGATGVETVGYSNALPGGYGEQMVLSEGFMFEIPNGLATDQAALTEPMAVGAHAVNEANMTDRDVAVVIGCGPIGLAVIMSLKAKGYGPVIAADFSAVRRGMAEKAGADIIVDPAETSPYSKWAEMGVPMTTMERMMKEMAGESYQEPVIFECVGVPGVIQQVMEGAPVRARIVVVGVCMEKDQFEPALAINKQLDMKFVLGYSQDEFGETLHQIAEGQLQVETLITGKVGLDGVAQAFEDLKSAETHAKILVCPYHD